MASESDADFLLRVLSQIDYIDAVPAKWDSSRGVIVLDGSAAVSANDVTRFLALLDAAHA